MNEITIPEPTYVELVNQLLADNDEACAVLILVEGSEPQAERSRFLCREVVYPRESDYHHRSQTAVELSPQFVAAITKRARLEGWSLAFVHSHPGDLPPAFSSIDDAGERVLASFLASRIPDQINWAVVISAGGVRARALGTTEEASVIVIGETVRRISHPNKTAADAADRFDRQVRAFGREGQAVLQQLTAGIVGLGGTGSVIAQQLAHLGVRRFVLIDPDTLEATNLNRVVGSVPSDVGQAKTNIAKRMVQAIDPTVSVTTIQGDVTYARFASALTQCDCIFGCTDSHGSRAVMQQVAFQYLIPYIDMGVTITTNKGIVTGAFGRVQLLAPGFGCFTCGQLLDPEQVRRDMMNEFERKLDPYIVGGIEPAPAVISMNSAVASFSINMFLATFIGLPYAGRQLLVNFLTNSIRVVHTPTRPDCHICSRAGALARGVKRRLSARMD